MAARKRFLIGLSLLATVLLTASLVVGNWMTALGMALLLVANLLTWRGAKRASNDSPGG